MSARHKKVLETTYHGSGMKRMRGSLNKSHAKRQKCTAIVPYQAPRFPFSLFGEGRYPCGNAIPQPLAVRPPGFRINGTKVGPPSKRPIQTRNKAGEKEKGKAAVNNHWCAPDVVILSDSDEEVAGGKNVAEASSWRPAKKFDHVDLKRKERKEKRKGKVGNIVIEEAVRIHTFNANAPELDIRNVPRTRVKYVLRSFDDFRRQYLAEEHKRDKEHGLKRPDLTAYKAFKNYRVNGPESIMGTVPGVEVGDHYYFRVELLLISLHRQMQGGIDYIPESRSPLKDGQGRRLAVAVSVIASGEYDDDRDEGNNVLIYTGSGGNISKNSNKPASNQELVRGNMGLKNCCEYRIAVRVVRGYEYKKTSGYPAPSTKVYVYDGLYDVVSAEQVAGAMGNKVWQFKLVRQPGQGTQTSLGLFKGKFTSNILDGLGELVLVEDISLGQEPLKVRLVGSHGEMFPELFTYIKKCIFAPGVKQPPTEMGCGCSGSCMNNKSCGCVYLGDEGSDNYNDEGCLLIAKRAVYECGPLCQCNDAKELCANRVSQNGLRYELEVFQTKNKGWGLRSRQFIAQGSFVCEYVGQIIREVDAEARVARDDYMFELKVPNDMESRFDLADVGHRKISKLEDEEDCKFTIDARQYGNLARFINHSCDPNLFVQCVFFDHHDQRMPHVMLFASEHISPYVELTYDYGYIIDKVTIGGETVIKPCHCGARSCSGRLY